MSSPLPVLRGTLDVLVLRALLRSSMHGFEITTWLETQAAGDLLILDSALYQSLYRLERRRLIIGEWRVTPNSRRARYYSLTARGHARLRSDTGDWLRYARVITAILTDPRTA